MDILIDKTERFTVADEAQDALDALGSVSDYLRSKGRAVVRVMSGGKPVRTDEIGEQFRGKSICDVAPLEVESEDLAKLVAEALDELERAAPELAGLCHRLAEVFQGEDPEAGYEPFEQLAEIWKTVKDRELQVAMALDLDWEGLSIKNTPIGRLHEELNDYLAEAAESLKVEDCVLLGDLLEYELAPKAELEPEIVALLRSKAAEMSK